MERHAGADLSPFSSFDKVERNPRDRESRNHGCWGDGGRTDREDCLAVGKRRGSGAVIRDSATWPPLLVSRWHYPISMPTITDPLRGLHSTWHNKRFLIPFLVPIAPGRRRELAPTAPRATSPGYPPSLFSVKL